MFCSPCSPLPLAWSLLEFPQTCQQIYGRSVVGGGGEEREYNKLRILSATYFGMLCKYLWSKASGHYNSPISLLWWLCHSPKREFQVCLWVVWIWRCSALLPWDNTTSTSTNSPWALSTQNQWRHLSTACSHRARRVSNKPGETQDEGAPSLIKTSVITQPVVF